MQEEDQIFKKLLRQYEDTRLLHERERRERKAALYEKYPIFDEIDQKIASESVAAATARLEGKTSDLSALNATLSSLSNEKKALLQKYGYPQDYLELTYTCPFCQDTGMVGDSRCHCLRQALTRELSRDSSQLSLLAGQNFSTFSYDYYDDVSPDVQLHMTPLQNIKNVVAEAKRFVQNFDREYQNLLIYGNTGVGKTFLSNCIADALINSAHHVVYLSAHKLFDVFRANQSFKPEEDSSLLYRYIFDCDLLIIDDFGTEAVNSFTNSCLYDCLNERLVREKSVIISTNLSLDQLQANYSERIFSRILGNYTLLKLLGKDIRLQKLSQKKN